MNNSETLAAYRSNHKIHLEPTDEPHVYRCSVDGLRVIPLIRGDRWRHHPDDIARLLDAEYGGPWGSRKYETDDERKIAAIGRIVDLADSRNEDDDEEPFDNREGQPEFNGAFG